MPTITQILAKVFPKLNAIEEGPVVTIMKTQGQTSSNPFSGTQNDAFSSAITVDCIFSDQPELVTANSNITTQQQMYLYVRQVHVEQKASALPENQRSVWFDEVGNGIITMKDRFVFSPSKTSTVRHRFRPIEVQLLFGLWKVKVNKE